MRSYLATLLLACAVVVSIALLRSDDADAAANNTRPIADIVGQNGLAAPQILSNDPQIGDCNFDATGVTVTETTLTTFASSTHYPCEVLRGAMVDDDTNGYEQVARNGLYRASFSVNCTGVTTETGRVTAQISYDGGSNFAQITGADARTLFLTGTLQHNMSGSGYVSIAQTSTALSSGQVVVALRGSSSGAGDMTCANGGGLRLERVDQAQPVTYP